MDTKKFIETASTRELFSFMIDKKLTRKALINIVAKRMYNALVVKNPDNRPRRVVETKYRHLMALMYGVDRALSRGFISRHVIDRILEVFLQNVLLNKRQIERQGEPCPSFLTISPTGRCNLKCTGCYAASSPDEQHGSLDFETFDKVICQKRELWDSYFTVVSGGEPFLWKDGNRGLLDLVAKHSTEYFMAYTNGVAITDDVARQLADLGNLTPAISVEGFEEETDARRGKGVYRKIMIAMEHLRRHGVPFGISVTPTKYNWKVLMSERFVDFYFYDQGAVYGWLFQYMPIGRGPSLDMMVPPADRVEMLKQMFRLVTEKKVFYVDFWNSGLVSSGCISAGRPGGYFYIDWNGNICPCVFIPYAVDNIKDVFARGQNLNDVLNNSFLKDIRQWQADYGYQRPATEVNNWLAPCVIRDHFDYIRDRVLKSGARPINPEAATAIKDEAYCCGMRKYGEEIERLTRPIWDAEFADPAAVESQHSPVDHARTAAG